MKKLLAQSIQCHHHRECHLDELFIFIDGVQGAADVIGYVGRAALLDPVRKLQDGGFEGELVFVNFESREGSRSELGIAIPL